MDDKQRANPFEEGVLSAVIGQLANTWTALPGEIVSFDPEAQTCTFQPTIQAEVTDKDGSVSLATLPLLLDCPVHFPVGGDSVITFPVVEGDEGLAVFSSRCIDSWWQSSGVQPQAELRMHDLSDGFVFVGFRSKPNVISDISATAVEIRSADGATKISLDPAAQTIDMTAPGGATITADVTIDGTLHVTGNITTDAKIEAAGDIESDGDVKAGSISLKTHKHGGVTIGGAQTGVAV